MLNLKKLFSTNIIEDNKNRTLSHIHLCFSDRYTFDNITNQLDGWKDWKTSQDCPYFGLWICRDEMQILSYTEGDVYFNQYKSKKSFVEGIKSMIDFYNSNPPK